MNIKYIPPIIGVGTPGDTGIKTIISQLCLLIKTIIPELCMYLLGIQILLVIGTLWWSSQYVIRIVKEFSTIQNASISFLYLIGGILTVVVVYMLISKLRAILLPNKDENDG